MTLRCINCSLRIARVRRHRLSEEGDETLERVRRWVYPRDISGTDYICHACWELINRNHDQQSDASVGHRNVCVTCGRSILRVRSRIVLDGGQEVTERVISIRNLIAEWIHPVQLQPSHEVCIPCWLRAQRAVNNRLGQYQVGGPPAGPSIQLNVSQEVDVQEPQESEVQEPQEAEQHSEPSIELPTMKRAAATAARCLFAECDERNRLRIPDTIRRRIIVDFNFYIPISARICHYHLESNLFHELYAADNAMTTFTATYIEDIMFLLKNNHQLDFSQPENIDDHLFKYWFGRTKNEYNTILLQVPRLNEKKIKMGFNALLCKMRTGDSDERIAALFNVPRRTLEGYLHQTRDILLQNYVPLHLGLNHITRKEIVLRNSHLANNLFGNPEEPLENRQLIAIADGTYLNTQKSSNHTFQKNTYSLHKYHNLVKPFLIVCCDGYIIDALGPYAATKNDATIMQEWLDRDDIWNIFREDDIFILDRGFRDCRDKLYQKGFQVHMPETIDDGERQLTTLQANITRCVTMNRWVVEAVNGRFSRDFKIFREKIGRLPE